MFKRILMTAAVLALTVSIAQAGILTDMGVTVQNNNGTTYSVLGGGHGTIATSYAGTDVTVGDNPGYDLYYHVEDNDDTKGHSDILGPHAGGQDYDAEFLGVYYDGTSIYIGVLTGQRKDNGLSFFSPGDIRIITSSGDEYWIEVGGSAGLGTGGNVALGNPGSTYNLNSNGTTASVTSHTASQPKAGDIYKNPTVINSVPPDVPPTPVQIKPTTGGFVGTSTTFSYTFYTGSGATGKNQHAGIEVSLLGSLLLGSGSVTKVEWRPSCANDEVLVTITDIDIDIDEIPEPSAIAVWSILGIIGLAGRWRCRKAVRGE